MSDSTLKFILGIPWGLLSVVLFNHSLWIVHNLVGEKLAFFLLVIIALPGTLAWITGAVLTSFLEPWIGKNFLLGSVLLWGFCIIYGVLFTNLIIATKRRFFS